MDLYILALKTNKTLSNLKYQEPTIIDPELLTDDIMSGINNLGTEKSVQTIGNRSKVLIWGERLLAAASIILFLTFGFEQFIVVDKITTLEARLTGISANIKIEVNNAQIIATPDFFTKKLSEKPLLKRILMQRFNLTSLQDTFQIKKTAHD
jgi:hypothetical protein